MVGFFAAIAGLIAVFNSSGSLLTASIIVLVVQIFNIAHATAQQEFLAQGRQYGPGDMVIVTILNLIGLCATAGCFLMMFLTLAH